MATTRPDRMVSLSPTLTVVRLVFPAVFTMPMSPVKLTGFSAFAWAASAAAPATEAATQSAVARPYPVTRHPHADRLSGEG